MNKTDGHSKISPTSQKDPFYAIHLCSFVRTILLFNLR